MLLGTCFCSQDLSMRSYPVCLQVADKRGPISGYNTKDLTSDHGRCDRMELKSWQGKVPFQCIKSRLSVDVIEGKIFRPVLPILSSDSKNNWPQLFHLYFCINLYIIVLHTCAIISTGHDTTNMSIF